MKKEEAVNLVQGAIERTQDLNALTVDKINDLAPPVQDPIFDPIEALKSKAKAEGALWLEPKRRMQAFGKLRSEWERKHKYDWEYVCGIFQPEVVGGRIIGEPKCFWLCKWPGDPDCLWEVPVNRKVYLPRFVAKHLSGERDEDTGMECMKYHTFDYMQLPEAYLRPDAQQEQFRPTGTHYTGRFMPIGVFS